MDSQVDYLSRAEILGIDYYQLRVSLHPCPFYRAILKFRNWAQKSFGRMPVSLLAKD